MTIPNSKLTSLVIIIVATGSLMVGVNSIVEHIVKAQNMTTNATNPGGNITGTDDGSGSISAVGRNLVSTGPGPP
jgi:hypothetical protein